MYFLSKEGKEDQIFFCVVSINCDIIVMLMKCFREPVMYLLEREI